MSQKAETDDVLEFLNSLPETKPGTPAASGVGGGETKVEDNDFLDFLDELALHETKTKPKPKSKLAAKPSSQRDSDTLKDSLPMPVAASVAAPASEQEAMPPVSGMPPSSSVDATATPAAETPEPDAIASISNWWSLEGSNKVSSLWGSIASNAHSLDEQTFQLASTTTNQLNHQRQKLLEELDAGSESVEPPILGTLNLIFTNIRSQISLGLIDDDDELLNVFLVYDIQGIRGLDQAAHTKLSKVMGQVEGGIRVSVSNYNHIRGDGAMSVGSHLGMFYGKPIDGEKLCFANLELAAQEYAKHTAAEPSAESLMSTSTIFISIQPISSHVGEDSEAVSRDEDKPVLIEASNPHSFAFTIILKDVTNGITIVTKTQPFPLQWALWLDGEALKPTEEPHESNQNQSEGSATDLVDPSEWVRQWVFQGLDLGLGVVAQEYVIKRMGI